MKITIVFFMAMSVLQIFAMDKELKVVTLKPMSEQRYVSCVALSFLFDSELLQLIQGHALELVKNSAGTVNESALCMQLEGLKVVVDFKNTEQLNLSHATINHNVSGAVATIIFPKKLNI